MLAARTIDAALGRRRHDPRPLGLEARPRHDAVLKAEQSDQRDVDDDRERRPAHCGPISTVRRREGEIADEDDQIEESREEDRVSRRLRKARADCT